MKAMIELEPARLRALLVTYRERLLPLEDRETIEIQKHKREFDDWIKESRKPRDYVIPTIYGGVTHTISPLKKIPEFPSLEATADRGRALRLIEFIDHGAKVYVDEEWAAKLLPK